MSIRTDFYRSIDQSYLFLIHSIFFQQRAILLGMFKLRCQLYLFILGFNALWLSSNAMVPTNPIDSLKSIIADCKPTEEPKLYLDLVVEIMKISNNEDSIWHYLQKANNASIIVKDQKSRVKALRLMAYEAGKKQDYAEAETYFDEGIALAKENADSLGLADTYYTRARYFFSKADQEGFVNNILKAIDLYDALEEWSKKGKALITLAIQYARIKEIKLAIEKLNEAKEIESYFTPEVKLYLSLHLGKNYRRLATIEDDDSLLIRAIDILEKGKKEAENASIKSSMGDFYLALLDCYPLLEPPIYPYGLADKTIQLGKEINDYFLVYQGYLGKSHMYYYEDRYQEALRIRSAMEKALNKLNNPVYRRSFNNISYEISKGLNRNGEALYYLERLKTLNDSILDVQRTSQFNEIVEKYESEKKEKEILALSDEKEKLLIQNELSASKVRIRNLWIGFLALLSLVGIGLVYVVQRQKRSEAEKRSLEIEQQLLRAQMNPHFIFNSLNGIKRFYVEGRTEDANDFLADFSKLLRTILDRSDKTEVSVDGEIEFLQLYLELEKRRLNDKLGFEIDYNADDFDYDDIIPSFIIQPLVENAIWHGIQKKEGHGKIKIKVFKEDQDILIEVMDNGIGLHKNRQKKGLHKSKGLQLIRERLGNKGSLHLNDLSSTDNEYNGTLATLKIQLD